MGFFSFEDNHTPEKSAVTKRGAASLEFLHEQGCKVCPLNNSRCHTPKMAPAGAKKPVLYILSDAPSGRADKSGKPFSDDVGAFIRKHIPDAYRDQIRWGYVVKTHTGKGVEIEDQNRDGKITYVFPRTPTFDEIECCRPQVIEDIEAAKPDAVIVIGKVPLHWIARETHAYLWQGRRFPARVGKHSTWVHPFVHPYDVLKDKRWDTHVPDSVTNWGRKFKEALKQIFKKGGKPPKVWTEAMARKDVEWVTGENGDEDLRKLYKHFEDCANSSAVGQDYETSALRPYNDDSQLLTGSLSTTRRTVAFPFSHREAGWTEKQKTKLYSAFGEFLLAPNVIKIAHQLAFEMEWSAFIWGEEVCRGSNWGDSISQAYIISEKQGMLGLENLTQQYYGINLKELSSVNRKKMADEPLIKILPYNGMDSKFHLKLFLRQAPIIRVLELEDVYQHQIETIPSLVLTQLQGIPIDQKELKDFAKIYIREQKKALAELMSMQCVAKFEKKFGAEFNPQSNPDTKKMLTMLGLPNVGGDEKQLRGIAHPFGKALIKWRKPTKILSTYCYPVMEGREGTLVTSDKLVHPIISTYKVETWRTSSEDPNAQNWPKRGPNKVIRRIVKKKGRKVVAFDYASIQARNIAMESEDPNLVQAFFDWYDIHADWVTHFAQRYPKWAPKDWEKPEVFKELRGGVKNGFVFPSFFGAQAKSMTVSMNALGRNKIPVEVVQEVQDDLFERFPGVKTWQESLKQMYERKGYVTGHSGFRRHAPISFNQLINSPIQSDERIIVLSAMNALSKRDYKLYQPTMEIHDDLTFIWPTDEVEKRSEVVISEMLKVRFDWINVPLVVERLIGDNWCDLKEEGNFESVGTDEWRQVDPKNPHKSEAYRVENEIQNSPMKGARLGGR